MNEFVPDPAPEVAPSEPTPVVVEVSPAAESPTSPVVEDHPFASLREHIGRQAEILLSNGDMVLGRIAAVEGPVVTVEDEDGDRITIDRGEVMRAMVTRGVGM